LRSSVIVGTTMGETQFIENRLTSDASNWLTSDHMSEILSGRPGSIADHVCRDLDITAPPCDLYGACAAGNMAIAAARRQLLDGRCDIALAGGADGFSRLAFLGFMRLRVMAAEVCRPFDERRDGFVVSARPSSSLKRIRRPGAAYTPDLGASSPAKIITPLVRTRTATALPVPLSPHSQKPTSPPPKSTTSAPTAPAPRKTTRSKSPSSKNASPRASPSAPSNPSPATPWALLPLSKPPPASSASNIRH
jgi:3-oxoacyl-[acyl-carrier-protein] synthase II